MYTNTLYHVHCTQVVEREDSTAQEQADSLRLSANLISYSAHYHGAWRDLDGYGLLNVVIGNAKCRVGFPLVKV